MEHTEGVLHPFDKDTKLVLKPSEGEIEIESMNYKESTYCLKFKDGSSITVGGKDSANALANSHEVKKRWNSHPELVEALEEAKLQIEYLHGKFKETGTGNAVLTKIEQALSKVKE